ncbi:MAG: DinB family protein [Bacteroidetes bacterium]|nr:DinB family protein [Bacteroidota bacterium]
MKQYLIDTFRFNEQANLRLLNKIKVLPDGEQCIKLFSHLINSQDKWMSRVLINPEQTKMDWWNPIYAIDKLDGRLVKSVDSWVSFLEGLSDEEINQTVQFIGYDGAKWEAKIVDIALQLNYHSIHHRAQIQTIIRAQGFEPDFLDYIGTKYKRLG